MWNSDILRFKHLPAGNSVRKWSAVLFRVGVVQAVVQAVQIGTGIWIVRGLPRTEYAYYTIANTMFFAIFTLADSGIAASLSAAGGRVWSDSTRLGELLKSALTIRRELFAIVAVVVIPILIGLLLHNQAPLSRALFIAVIVAVTLIGEMTTHTYLVVFRLRNQFKFTQRVALAGALGRIVWWAACSLTYVRAEMAFLASSVNTLAYWILLRRKIADHAAPPAEQPDPAIAKETRTIVARQLPLNIYYCLQGQVNVWLASALGSAGKVSDIGALGRFGALFTVSLCVVQEVVLPAFSRAQSCEVIRRRYFQIVFAYTLMLAAMVLIVGAFRDPVLAIFGPQYSRLGAELVLAMVFAAITALTQVLWQLNSSRAWIISPVPYISVTTLLQAVLFMTINVSTVRGILWFSILSLGPAVVFPLWLSLKNLRLLDSVYREPLVESTSA